MVQALGDRIPNERNPTDRILTIQWIKPLRFLSLATDPVILYLVGIKILKILYSPNPLR
jgi:hypothetical protein